MRVRPYGIGLAPDDEGEKAMNASRAWLVGALLAIPALPALAQAPAAAPACDRQCLQTYVDRYIDAMVAHKVDDALFAREVRFTENGIRLPLGSEGSWHLATARGTYSFYVPDVETQQVAFLGTLRERGRSATEQRVVGYSLRLKVRDGRITEVEQLVSRPATNLFAGGGNAAPSTPFGNTGDNVEKMGAPHPRFAADIPASASGLPRSPVSCVGSSTNTVDASITDGLRKRRRYTDGRSWSLSWSTSR